MPPKGRTPQRGKTVIKSDSGAKQVPQTNSKKPTSWRNVNSPGTRRKKIEAAQQAKQPPNESAEQIPNAFFNNQNRSQENNVRRNNYKPPSNNIITNIEINTGRFYSRLQKKEQKYKFGWDVNYLMKGNEVFTQQTEAGYNKGKKTPSAINTFFMGKIIDPSTFISGLGNYSNYINSSGIPTWKSNWSSVSNTIVPTGIIRDKSRSIIKKIFNIIWSYLHAANLARFEKTIDDLVTKETNIESVVHNVLNLYSRTSRLRELSEDNFNPNKILTDLTNLYNMDNRYVSILEAILNYDKSNSKLPEYFSIKKYKTVENKIIIYRERGHKTLLSNNTSLIPASELLATDLQLALTNESSYSEKYVNKPEFADYNFYIVYPPVKNHLGLDFNNIVFVGHFKSNSTIQDINIKTHIDHKIKKYKYKTSSKTKDQNLLRQLVIYKFVKKGSVDDKSVNNFYKELEGVKIKEGGSSLNIPNGLMNKYIQSTSKSSKTKDKGKNKTKISNTSKNTPKPPNHISKVNTSTYKGILGVESINRNDLVKVLRNIQTLFGTIIHRRDGSITNKNITNKNKLTDLEGIAQQFKTIGLFIVGDTLEKKQKDILGKISALMDLAHKSKLKISYHDFNDLKNDIEGRAYAQIVHSMGILTTIPIGFIEKIFEMNFTLEPLANKMITHMSGRSFQESKKTQTPVGLYWEKKYRECFECYYQYIQRIKLINKYLKVDDIKHIKRSQNNSKKQTLQTYIEKLYELFSNASKCKEKAIVTQTHLESLKAQISNAKTPQEKKAKLKNLQKYLENIYKHQGYKLQQTNSKSYTEYLDQLSSTLKNIRSDVSQEFKELTDKKEKNLNQQEENISHIVNFNNLNNSNTNNSKTPRQEKTLFDVDVQLVTAMQKKFGIASKLESSDIQKIYEKGVSQVISTESKTESQQPIQARWAYIGVVKAVMLYHIYGLLGVQTPGTTNWRSKIKNTGIQSNFIPNNQIETKDGIDIANSILTKLRNYNETDRNNNNALYNIFNEIASDVLKLERLSKYGHKFIGDNDNQQVVFVHLVNKLAPQNVTKNVTAKKANLNNLIKNDNASPKKNKQLNILQGKLKKLKENNKTPLENRLKMAKNLKKNYGKYNPTNSDKIMKKRSNIFTISGLINEYKQKIKEIEEEDVKKKAEQDRLAKEQAKKNQLAIKNAKEAATAKARQNSINSKRQNSIRELTQFRNFLLRGDLPGNFRTNEQYKTFVGHRLKHNYANNKNNSHVMPNLNKFINQSGLIVKSAISQHVREIFTKPKQLTSSKRQNINIIDAIQLVKKNFEDKPNSKTSGNLYKKLEFAIYLKNNLNTFAKPVEGFYKKYYEMFNALLKNTVGGTLSSYQTSKKNIHGIKYDIWFHGYYLDDIDSMKGIDKTIKNIKTQFDIYSYKENNNKHGLKQMLEEYLIEGTTPENAFQSVVKYLAGQVIETSTTITEFNKILGPIQNKTPFRVQLLEIENTLNEYMQKNNFGKIKYQNNKLRKYVYTYLSGHAGDPIVTFQKKNGVITTNLAELIKDAITDYHKNLLNKIENLTKNMNNNNEKIKLAMNSTLSEELRRHGIQPAKTATNMQQNLEKKKKIIKDIKLDTGVTTNSHLVGLTQQELNEVSKMSKNNKKNIASGKTTLSNVKKRNNVFAEINSTLVNKLNINAAKTKYNTLKNKNKAINNVIKSRPLIIQWLYNIRNSSNPGKQLSDYSTGNDSPEQECMDYLLNKVIKPPTPTNDLIKKYANCLLANEKYYLGNRQTLNAHHFKIESKLCRDLINDKISNQDVDKIRLFIHSKQVYKNAYVGSRNSMTINQIGLAAKRLFLKENQKKNPNLQEYVNKVNNGNIMKLNKNSATNNTANRARILLLMKNQGFSYDNARTKHDIAKKTKAAKRQAEQNATQFLQSEGINVSPMARKNLQAVAGLMGPDPTSILKKSLYVKLRKENIPHERALQLATEDGAAKNYSTSRYQSQIIKKISDNSSLTYHEAKKAHMNNLKTSSNLQNLKKVKQTLSSVIPSVNNSQAARFKALTPAQQQFVIAATRHLTQNGENANTALTTAIGRATNVTQNVTSNVAQQTIFVRAILNGMDGTNAKKHLESYNNLTPEQQKIYDSMINKHSPELSLEATQDYTPYMNFKTYQNIVVKTPNKINIAKKEARKKYNSAATQIQSVFRGRRNRQQFTGLKTTLNQEKQNLAKQIGINGSSINTSTLREFKKLSNGQQKYALALAQQGVKLQNAITRTNGANNYESLTSNNQALVVMMAATKNSGMTYQQAIAHKQEISKLSREQRTVYDTLVKRINPITALKHAQRYTGSTMHWKTYVNMAEQSPNNNTAAINSATTIQQQTNINKYLKQDQKDIYFKILENLSLNTSSNQNQNHKHALNAAMKFNVTEMNKNGFINGYLEKTTNNHLTKLKRAIAKGKATFKGAKPQTTPNVAPRVLTSIPGYSLPPRSGKSTIASRPLNLNPLPGHNNFIQKLGRKTAQSLNFTKKFQELSQNVQTKYKTLLSNQQNQVKQLFGQGKNLKTAINTVSKLPANFYSSEQKTQINTTYNRLSKLLGI